MDRIAGRCKGIIRALAIELLEAELERRRRLRPLESELALVKLRTIEVRLDDAVADSFASPSECI